MPHLSKFSFFSFIIMVFLVMFLFILTFSSFFYNNLYFKKPVKNSLNSKESFIDFV